MPRPAPAAGPGKDAPAVAGRIEPIGGGGATIAELLPDWIEHLQLRDLAPRHITLAASALRRAVREQGWVKPQDITVGTIRAHLADLKLAGRKAKTRNTIRSYLSSFCAFALEAGAIRSNPVSGSPWAKVVPFQARIVPTEATVLRLIIAAGSDWRKKDRWLLYLAAASTGLRMGTLGALEWAHFKSDCPFPHLDIPGRLLKPREPKIMYLTAELAGYLREHRRRAGNRKRIFECRPKWDGFVRDCAKARIARAGEAEKAGPTLSPHSLRHFASNRMLWVDGFSLRERAAQNGHQSTAMTKEIYTDPASVELARKVLAMPDLLPWPAPADAAGWKKILAKGRIVPDTPRAKPVMRTPTTQDRPAAGRLGEATGFATSSPSGRPAADGPHDLGGSRGNGVPLAPIGVTGFEPDTPILVRMLPEALDMAESAIRLTRLAMGLNRKGAAREGGDHGKSG